MMKENQKIRYKMKILKKTITSIYFAINKLFT